MSIIAWIILGVGSLFADLGFGAALVQRASLSTAPTKAADGRLSTHSPERIMFSVVLEFRASPSMQRQPTHMPTTLVRD